LPWAPKFPWGILGALQCMLILGSFYISIVAYLLVTHYEKDVFTNFEGVTSARLNFAQKCAVIKNS
jgi:hypothetical protein